jgi:hypothetical protein
MLQVNSDLIPTNLCNRGLDNGIVISQGEIHLHKSEYAEARNICNHIVETTSPEQDPSFYVVSLVNIAHIAAICGNTRYASLSLNQAKKYFEHFYIPESRYLLSHG